MSASSKAVTIVAPKTTVTISKPFLTKTSQVYGSKSVAKATVAVFGTKSGKVTFYNGKTKLGTAKIKNGLATVKFAKKLKAGSYKVVAKISATSTTTAATSPAAKFKATKAKLAKKATVTGKSFKKGAKPKVTVTLGKLNNGAYATGKVKVYVGKKVVRTVTVKAKHKGKITVTLPKSKKSVKVKAAFQGSKNVAKSTSKAKTIKVKK